MNGNADKKWFGKEQNAHDVVLLGAGFSKAVSGHFPLMPELGQCALDEANISAGLRPPKSTNFEAWLSLISEDQPYRSVEDNLKAKGLFMRMGTAIAKVMRIRQHCALQGAPLAWLDDLISVLHARQSTVISFNYDNVVECAVDGHCLTDWTGGWTGQVVTSHDIVDRIPPLPPAILSGELPDQVARSLRLLKLHGSLSWYWSPDDETGVTLQRWRVPGTFGGHSPDDEEARLRALPGRVPFIVPPTAIKSSYLTNLVVREIWRRARTALVNAKRLIVIGYSVPPEDQVVSGMLVETIRERDVEVIVVDLDPCATVKRLKDLGVTARGWRCFGGQSCVEKFANWYRDEQARAVVESLRECALSDEFNTNLRGQVNVNWGRCGDANCQGSYAGGLGHSGQPNLDDIENPAGGEDILVPLAPLETKLEVDQTQVPTLLDIISKNTKATRLVVHDTSGRDFPVVDYTVRQPTSNDPSNHLTLVPSGHPRRAMSAWMTNA